MSRRYAADTTLAVERNQAEITAVRAVVGGGSDDKSQDPK